MRPVKASRLEGDRLSIDENMALLKLHRAAIQSAVECAENMAGSDYVAAARFCAAVEGAAVSQLPISYRLRMEKCGVSLQFNLETQLLSLSGSPPRSPWGCLLGVPPLIRLLSRLPEGAFLSGIRPIFQNFVLENARAKSACTGCRYKSGSHLLHCAVHPMGPPDLGSCPDWACRHF